MWPVVAAVLPQDLPALLQPRRDCSPAGQGGVYGGDPTLREQLPLPPPSPPGPAWVQWPAGTVMGQEVHILTGPPSPGSPRALDCLLLLGAWYPESLEFNK